jgi:GntR family transcriptional regulator, galactonate operon transcriptional repressor
MPLQVRSKPAPLKRNLREQLVEQLGGDIVRGRLLPGDPLPNEEELLNRYDVSRTVLREALNVLSGKGLLDAKPRRGTIVRPRAEWSQLDPSILGWRDDPAEPMAGNLDQLMELRRIIEPAAAELAARRGTAEDLAAIARTYDLMVAAGNDVPAFVAADVEFHIACLQAARNEFLLPVTHAIRASLVQSMRITNRDSEQNRTVTLPLHRAIRDAILDRDAAKAREAMQVHLDDTERRRVAMEAAPAHNGRKTTKPASSPKVRKTAKR